jgi:hypothetical protein
VPYNTGVTASDPGAAYKNVIDPPNSYISGQAITQYPVGAPPLEFADRYSNWRQSADGGLVWAQADAWEKLVFPHAAYYGEPSPDVHPFPMDMHRLPELLETLWPLVGGGPLPFNPLGYEPASPLVRPYLPSILPDWLAPEYVVPDPVGDPVRYIAPRPVSSAPPVAPFVEPSPPLPRPVIIRDFHRRVPPGPGVKERKFIPRYGALRSVLNAFGATSELRDAIKPFWETLPKGVKQFSFHKGKPVTPSLGKMTAQVYQHWDKVDVNAALLDFMKNQLQDEVIGRAHRVPKGVSGRDANHLHYTQAVAEKMKRHLDVRVDLQDDPPPVWDDGSLTLRDWYRETPRGRRK